MKYSGTIITLAVTCLTATTRFGVHALVVQSSIQWHTSVQVAKPPLSTNNGRIASILHRRLGDRANLSSVLKASSDDILDDAKGDETDLKDRFQKSAGKLALFGGIGFLYWYWMVLGAYAASEGLPGIPSFLPLTPGWPPSMEDLQPALEDSAHFFYLADLLHTDAPPVQPVRLALFNIAEAWIFAFLPALWCDPKRLPRPVLLALWLVLGINLTNAFLAPYLLVTEAATAISPLANGRSTQKNQIVSALFAAVALAVTGAAFFTTATLATPADWEQMNNLIQTDRTYLAFVVDLCLFSVFQPLILHRARGQLSPSPLDAVPLVGLTAWLLESSSSATDNETVES